jgi:hypothetical protein
VGTMHSLSVSIHISACPRDAKIYSHSIYQD